MVLCVGWVEVGSGGCGSCAVSKFEGTMSQLGSGDGRLGVCPAGQLLVLLASACLAKRKPKYGLACLLIPLSSSPRNISKGESAEGDGEQLSVGRKEPPGSVGLEARVCDIGSCGDLSAVSLCPWVKSTARVALLGYS